MEERRYKKCSFYDEENGFCKRQMCWHEIMPIVQFCGKSDNCEFIEPIERKGTCEKFAEKLLMRCKEQGGVVYECDIKELLESEAVKNG